MKISSKGIDLIKQFEGCRLKAYICPAGIPTIGYGNTFYIDGHKVKIGDKITQEMADDMLMDLLPKFEKIVSSKVRVPLNQNQFDALVSHTWNTGGSQTLFDLVNRKSLDPAIKTWFEEKYITGNGVVLPGLVKRRKSEAKLYFTK